MPKGGKGRIKEQERRRTRRIKALTAELLKDGCSSCGEPELCCLDFHHLDPKTKEKTIARIKTERALLKEAAKCIVLCSNCHRKLHAGKLLPIGRKPNLNQISIFEA